MRAFRLSPHVGPQDVSKAPDLTDPGKVKNTLKIKWWHTGRSRPFLSSQINGDGGAQASVAICVVPVQGTAEKARTALINASPTRIT